MRDIRAEQQWRRSISEFVNLKGWLVCSCASMQAVKMKIPPFDSAFPDLCKEVILIDIPIFTTFKK